MFGIADYVKHRQVTSALFWKQLNVKHFFKSDSEIL
jgi:hypothetical protein